MLRSLLNDIIPALRQRFVIQQPPKWRNEMSAEFQIGPADLAGPVGVVSKDGRNGVVIARTFELCLNQ